MTSSATTASTTSAATPAIPASTPATSYHQHENNDIPHPTERPIMTNDFHRDTFFNPIWMPGPHVFSFAENGTVVRPETYASEHYHRTRGLHSEAVHASHFQGLSGRGEEKPWKNVAITEQDDAEFAAMQARAWARANAVGEWEQQQMYYGHVNAQRAMPNPEEPELVYTWPPPPQGHVNAQRAMPNREEPELVYTWPPPPQGR